MTAELDPRDLTLQVHSQALKEIEHGGQGSSDNEIIFQQINEKIYLLLLKNVGRDVPLSPDEIQYLREFRSSMSGEQWQRWLVYARSERKRLKEMGQVDNAINRSSSSFEEEQSMETTYLRDDSSGENVSFGEMHTGKSLSKTMSLAEAIDAGIEKNNRNMTLANTYSEPASHPQIPSSGSSRRRSLFHMTNVSTESSLHHHIDPSLIRRIPPTLGQPSLAPPKPESRIPATALARKASREINLNRTTNMSNSLLDLNETFGGVQNFSSPVSKRETSNHSGSARHYSALEVTPAVAVQAQQDGFSTSKPSGLCSQSAPRMRPTPSNLSPVSTTGNTSNYYQSQKHRSPARSSGFTSRIANNPYHPSNTSSASLSQIKPKSTGFTHTSSNAPNVPELASPTRVMTNFVTKYAHDTLNKRFDVSSDEYKEYYSPEANNEYRSEPEISSSAFKETNLDLEDLRVASESAQIGSNRIDNACTAAKFLINSLSTLSNQVDPSTLQKLQSSRNMLEEMLHSLEKSKVNFGHIEDSVKEDINVEDLHSMILNEATYLDADSEFSLPPSIPSEAHAPSDDYLRFQPNCSDDLQSLQSQHTQQSPSLDRPIGGNYSSILGRGVSSQQQQQFQPSYDLYQQTKEVSNVEDSFPSMQMMWSSSQSFRGGQPVLVENHVSSTQGRNQAENTLGLVTRVCINRGSLAKAFDDFPIRLDLEAMSLDIIWRESRLDLMRGSALIGSTVQTNKNRNASASRYMHPTTSSAAAAAVTYYQPVGGNSQDLYELESQRVLRRERFQFDVMYVGVSADRKLQEYVRFRTRAVIEKGTNLVFLCNACGESLAGELEAPVTVTLGSGGGSGIASNIVQEAFKYAQSHNVAQTGRRGSEDSKRLNSSYVMRSTTQSQYVSSKMALENKSPSVSLTAVLINGSTIVDMLSNASQHSRAHQPQPRIQRRSGGEVVLSGVTTLDLSNVMDFERIIGLLLGRRTGINETIQSMQWAAEETGESLPLSTLATWTTPSLNPAMENWRRLELLNEFSQPPKTSDSATRDVPSSSSTMMISFHIALGSTLFPKRMVNVRVVCPCGKDWSLPNFDLSVLSESISTLPHSTPESLLAVSPLTMLLTDMTQQPSNFVSVMNVQRIDSKRNAARVVQSEHDIAMTALNSMRVSCLAR